MPRRFPTILPDGWQVTRRNDGWWLQQRQPSGVWVDVSGPYIQRWGAVQRWQRSYDQTSG